MKPKTLTAIIRMFNATSDDATRFHLNHVYLQRPKGSTNVTLRATDGHIFANATIDDDSEFADSLKPGVDYVAQEESLPVLKALAKAYKRVGDIPMHATDKGVEVYDNTYRAKFQEASEAGFSFPRTAELWPKYRAEPLQIALNPQLLMDIFNAMKTHDKASCVTLVIKERLSPIRVLVGGNEGLLMPMRGEFKEYVVASEEQAEVEAVS